MKPKDGHTLLGSMFVSIPKYISVSGLLHAQQQ